MRMVYLTVFLAGLAVVLYYGYSVFQVESEQERVEAEHQSRIEAQQATVRESEHRRRWELAAVAASILAMAGFLVGTILGSRGRRHAEKEATL